MSLTILEVPLGHSEKRGSTVFDAELRRSEFAEVNLLVLPSSTPRRMSPDDAVRVGIILYVCVVSSVQHVASYRFSEVLYKQGTHKKIQTAVKIFLNLEPMVGFEPTTSALRKHCSTN